MHDGVSNVSPDERRQQQGDGEGYKQYDPDNERVAFEKVEHFPQIGSDEDGTHFMALENNRAHHHDSSVSPPVNLGLDRWNWRQRAVLAVTLIGSKRLAPGFVNGSAQDVGRGLQRR